MISVIMSIYNNSTTLQDSIDSILDQSFTDFEFLIIDDGSTDNTQKILDQYRSNKKVRLFKNQKNIGLTKSLNILIDKAKGEYIARHDADDISLKTRLEKQLNFMKKYNLQISTSRAVKSNNKKLIPGISYYIPNKLVMKYKNPFIHGTLLIDTEILKRFRYDEEYYFSQDYELFTRLIKDYKIMTINKGLYILNVENNISNKYKYEQNQDFLKAKNKFKSKYN